MTHPRDEFLPLSPATLHVLLALTGGDLHGYGILLEVARQSQGQYKMGPGTLYDNLRKLLKLGLVEDSRKPQPRGKASKDDARREYRLTDLGSSVLSAEADRLAGVLRETRRSLRLREEANEASSSNAAARAVEGPRSSLPNQCRATLPARAPSSAK